MSSSLRVGTGAVVVTLMAACGTSVSFVPLKSSPVPMVARSAQEVEVFNAEEPERPYVSVGMLEAQQSSRLSHHGMAEIIWELRATAGEAGCHGIIIQGASDQVVGGGVDGTSSVGTLKGYRAACIVYTGQPRGGGAAPGLAAPPSTACIPNETRMCFGPGACKGGQSCLADGSGFTPCDCGTSGDPTGDTEQAAPPAPDTATPAASPSSHELLPIED